ncbi:enoyl-CoA hydratase/isomerase family protein [Jiangella asiatica]|uniref:Enoyl-CoA hydratase/isomerase family protein n=1 Tax=Jiangella asiatica TaxID=2530372 RepID=A0A4R5CK45_9ACTN|nr:enoyl-CoA hydratase/isomerase family protein [Jiangella asiatica]TDE00669.1 enoyl-CoA hydratase/isomerase family protein [Jiangella asiatica]
MEAVLWERDGGVGWVRLNRPERRNAIDQATRRRLAEAFAELEADDDVGVIVLTGTGTAFCAGVDLLEEAPARGLLDLGAPVSAPVDRCTRPVLAAVNGPAVGGGFELALAADLRVAAGTAWFQLSELRLGSLPGSGGTQRLFDALPSALAWRMLLTGSRMDAADAARFGLVSDVLPAETFDADVAALVATLAEAAPLSMRAAKLARTAARGAGSELAMERLLWRLLATTEDRAEGRAAFREKRRPRFLGR